MFVSPLLPLAAAAAAVAAPTAPSARAESPSFCGRSFGPGAFNTAYNITLGALNVTGTINYTAPGVPIVLTGAGSSDADGVSNAMLTTATSSGLTPTFSFINGTLIPSGLDAGISAVNLNVSSGGTLGFAYAADPSQLPEAPEIYCSVADTDPAGGYYWPVVMVNGGSSFSLCGAENAALVVFEATSDNGGVYDFDSCYSVRLQQIYQQ